MRCPRSRRGAFCAGAAVLFLLICAVSTEAGDRVLAGRKWIVVHEKGCEAYDSVLFAKNGRTVQAVNRSGKKQDFPVHACIALMQRKPGALQDTGKRGFYVQLADGDMLMVRQPVFRGKKLLFSHGVWGRIDIDARHLYMLFRPEIRTGSIEADFTGLVLKNGDAAQGTISSLDGDMILVEMEGIGKIPVGSLSNVSKAVFSTRGKTAEENSGKNHTVIHLVTGEIISGTPVKGGKGVWYIQTAWSRKPVRIYTRYVESALFAGGKQFLSDTKPKNIKSSVWIGRSFGYSRDRSILGSPLSVRGFTAAKGIGLHSGTFITYDLSLPEKPFLFCGLAGIDSEAFYPGARTGLTVYIDGKPVKRVQLSSGGGMVPVFIRVKSGSKSLSFKTDAGSKGSVSGNVNLMWSSLLYGSL